MVTIKKIAEIVGVSPTTVSNVIHGRKNKVSAENYTKVKIALENNNYVSNMSGRTLARHGSRIIGVIVNYSRRSELNVVADPFYNQIIGYLEEQIRQNGYYMMLYTSGSVKESLKLASAWNIEGLVILGALPDDAEAFIRETDLPLAFIDTYVDRTLMQSGFINVGLQDFAGSYDITRYLIRIGHRKIAFCADGHHLIGVDKQRFLGYKQAMVDAGLELSENDFFGLDYRMSERHIQLKNLARAQFTNYTALEFTSDYLAVDAMNILQDNGIRVPNDLSITGFDCNIFAEQSRPRLTTVKQSVRDKAVYTIQYLMRGIRQGTSECVNHMLKTTIVVQGSTRPV
ncbi:MAG: LacI family DNA-binding transcriptional regulator [Sporolactobacillus sp.]